MFLHLPTRWKPRRLVAKRMRWELLGYGVRGGTFALISTLVRAFSSGKSRYNKQSLARIPVHLLGAAAGAGGHQVPGPW